jgi:hypothetical protein
VFLQTKKSTFHFTGDCSGKKGLSNENPVRAEIAANPEEYLYSFARNYSGEKGLIDIVFV